MIDCAASSTSPATKYSTRKSVTESLYAAISTSLASTSEMDPSSRNVSSPESQFGSFLSNECW